MQSQVIWHVEKHVNQVTLKLHWSKKGTIEDRCQQLNFCQNNNVHSKARQHKPRQFEHTNQQANIDTHMVNLNTCLNILEYKNRSILIRVRMLWLLQQHSQLTPTNDQACATAIVSAEFAPYRAVAALIVAARAPNNLQQ